MAFHSAETAANSSSEEFLQVLCSSQEPIRMATLMSPSMPIVTQRTSNCLEIATTVARQLQVRVDLGKLGGAIARLADRRGLPSSIIGGGRPRIEADVARASALILEKRPNFCGSLTAWLARDPLRRFEGMIFTDRL